MSIVDIAKIAKVSTSSVSNYFNRPERVGAATAARIRAAVQKTGYHPGTRRPGPKNGDRAGVRTANIALLMLFRTAPQELFTLPMIPQLLGSIHQALLSHKLQLLLPGIDPSGTLPECLDPRCCDGAILCGKPGYPGLIPALRKQLDKLPAVWCGSSGDKCDLPWDRICYDNSAIGAIAAEFLHRQGHRHVALFNPDLLNPAFVERSEAFLAAAGKLKLEATVFSAGFRERSRQAYALRFRQLAQAFLSSPAPVTGAFFCADDILAGVANELRGNSKGLELRHMIGCNGDEPALYSLTGRPATIDIRSGEIGRRAVERLLKRMRGDSTPPETELLCPRLLPGRFKF